MLCKPNNQSRKKYILLAKKPVYSVEISGTHPGPAVPCTTKNMFLITTTIHVDRFQDYHTHHSIDQSEASISNP